MPLTNKSSENEAEPIKLFLRIRPFVEQEEPTSCVEVLNSKDILVKVSYQKKFTFDQIFGPESEQIAIYNVLKPYISNVLSGYNCTVITYGQELTGKTYTMVGKMANRALSLQNLTGDYDNKFECDVIESGLIPRFVSDMFFELNQLKEQTSVCCTYFELFNEELRDLLSVSDECSNIRIYEDRSNKGAVNIQGLLEQSVKNKFELFKLLRKGQQKRQEAISLRRKKSGFSHTFFTIFVRMQETTNDGEELIKLGKISFVDLAGIEHINKYSGVERRTRDAGNVGQSLLTLGRVVKLLSEKNSHVPFRESKLTRILQDSLGGKSKTSIIATIAPSVTSFDETWNTLEFAQLARTICNKPEVNSKILQKALLAQYVDEITRLRKDLAAAHTGNGIHLDPDNYEKMLSDQQMVKDEVGRQKTYIKDLEKELNEKNDTIKTMNRNVHEARRNLHSCASDYVKTLTENKEKIALLKVHQTKVYDEVKQIISNNVKYKVKGKCKSVLAKSFDELQRNAENLNQVLDNHCEEFNQSLAGFQKWDNLKTNRVEDEEIMMDTFQSTPINACSETNNFMSLFKNLYSDMESTLMDSSSSKNIFEKLAESNARICVLEGTIANDKKELNQTAQTRRATMNEQRMEQKKQQLTVRAKVHAIRNNFKTLLINVTQQVETIFEDSLNILQNANGLIGEFLSVKNPFNELFKKYIIEAKNKNELVLQEFLNFSEAVKINSEEMITKTSNIHKEQKLCLDEKLEEVYKSTFKADTQVESFVKMAESRHQHSEQHNFIMIENIRQLQSLINCTDTKITEIKHAGDTPVRSNYKYPLGFKELTPKETALSRFREKENDRNADNV